MIFRKYATIESNKSPDELAKSITGQHLKVHNLDFEIMKKGDYIKIIPHAENDEKVHTLPITRLSLVRNNNGTKIKMMSKPRRIDAGGPTLLIFFILFSFIAGLVIYLKNMSNYLMAAYILMGISAVVFIIFWIQLERGYFDYIRKIKTWVKSHV